MWKATDGYSPSEKGYGGSEVVKFYWPMLWAIVVSIRLSQYQVWFPTEIKNNNGANQKN